MNMKMTSVAALICVLGASTYGQNSPENYAASITADDLKKHLEVLASDEYEGRETGKEGQRKAAAYIANQFMKCNFPPAVNGSYMQSIPLSENSWGDKLLVVNQIEYKFMKDFYAFPDLKKTKVYTNEIVFAGYGIKDSLYNDYANVEVGGKVLVIAGGEPVNKKGIYALSKTTNESEWSSSFFKKVKIARELKPALILYVDKDIATNTAKYKHYLEDPNLTLKEEEGTTSKEAKSTVLFISPALADSLLKSNALTLDKALTKINNGGKPKPFAVNSTVGAKLSRISTDIAAENVLGYLKGTDLADELLVISAHYDHIGIIDGEVYNGADDDGSGTVSVLEIAEAFSKAAAEGKGPRRSILFLAVSGEEKGLLGSEYYSEHPVFPLEKTVTDLNIDMVGRVDAKHKDSADYVYVIGSDKLSTTLHKINEEANAAHSKLKLDYTYNDPKDPNRFYYRSDHYNFAKHNIPIIFYFNGVHEDYHQKTDEISKINFDIMAKRAQLVFYTAWDIANRNERPAVDVKNDFPADK